MQRSFPVNFLWFVQRVGCLSPTFSSRTASSMMASIVEGRRGDQREDGNASANRTDSGPTKSPFETMNFDNVALRTLAIDSNKDNYVRKVSGAFFSRVQPVPVDNPQMVVFSASAARLIDLDPTNLEHSEAAEYFVGNRLFNGSDPAAHCYCGHQFGHFAGQLGDGAAMYLGEVVNQNGERWELQLKGAGPTPYSRDADGRKVLRSSIREFLCSEAMHHLNIPTTRAATCVTSDTKVVRDVFYSGNPIMEKCTVVSRIAPTFLRFGSFEIFKTLDPMSGRHGPSVGRNDLLRQLLDYTVSSFFPEIHSLYLDDSQKMFAEFFREVVKRTARLVAGWQCVGFCHGVLNTDNMSVLGLTIDYGPFGFLDHYNPNHICNGSDDGGRYSFANQPKVCGWNLAKFAEALQVFLPLEISTSILDETYFAEYDAHFMGMMRKKFGLIKELSEDRQLVEDFLETMAQTGADFTLSFRALSQITLPGSDDSQSTVESVKQVLLKCCCTVEQMRNIERPSMSESQLAVYVSLLSQHPELVEQLGRGAEAIEKELEKRKKFSTIKDLTAEDKAAQDDTFWTVWLKKYRLRLEVEVDENNDLRELNRERKKMMNANNPRYVLRNYLAQITIEAAEKGDFSEARKLLAILEDPFADVEISPFTQPTDGGGTCRNLDSYDLPPEWANKLRVTCSS